MDSVCDGTTLLTRQWLRFNQWSSTRGLCWGRFS